MHHFIPVKKILKPFLLVVNQRVSCLLLLEAYAREQTQLVQKIVSEHSGTDFVFAEDPEAKKELWKVKSLEFFHYYSFLLFASTS